MERGERRTGGGGACCSWSKVKTLQNGNGGWALPELSGWSTLHQRMLPIVAKG